MKLIKLTASSLLFFSLLFGFSSCEKEEDTKVTTDFSKTGIVLSGANETPATTSAALGKMDVFYTRKTRTLSYTVTWSGLTGAVTAMHIHGKAPLGFPASVFQNIITSSNGIFTPGVAYGTTGKVSATLFIDGFAIKEEDLLNGQYYMNIHTAANPGGEIRAQIVFQ